MSRLSGFDAPFGDGLGNQLPAFSQTYWVGTQMGLFGDPTDSS